jgi:hypothetical protein
MTLVKHALLVVTCGLVASHSPPAHADDSAAAEALFRDGRALIKAGKLEAGCEKLAASDKLEPSVGTLLNLGDCKEKLGQFASAWAAFRKAEAMAKRAGGDERREAEAKRRAERTEANIASLVLQIGPNAKATAGLVIRRDGEQLDLGVLNTPLPVDPGPHTIIAEAPGYKPFRTEVSIGKGGRRFVVIPTLEQIPNPTAATTPAPAPVVVQPPPSYSSEPSTVTVDTHPAPVIVREGTWTGTRKAAVVIAALGAAAVGGGIYFGTHASDLESRANAICPMSTCADPMGLKLNDDAQNAALRANMFLVAGGAAVATATIMWFLGSPVEHTVVSPAVGPTEVGASLTRRF